MGAGAGSLNIWASRRIAANGLSALTATLLGGLLTTPSGASFWDAGTLSGRLYAGARPPAPLGSRFVGRLARTPSLLRVGDLNLVGPGQPVCGSLAPNSSDVGPGRRVERPTTRSSGARRWTDDNGDQIIWGTSGDDQIIWGTTTLTSIRTPAEHRYVAPPADAVHARRHRLGARTVVVVQSLAVLPWMPHPLAWFLFAALAILTGSFTIRIASVEASISVADTFFITSALLFGPGPATVALAARQLPPLVAQGAPVVAVSRSTRSRRRSRCGSRRHAFFLMSGDRAAGERTVAGRTAHSRRSCALTHRLLRAELRADGGGRRPRHRSVAAPVWRHHFLGLSLELLRGGVGGASAWFS